MAVNVPEVHYARDRDGVSLAYQVVGRGNVDIVYAPPWLSNLELIWENPLFARFLTRLASFSRLIVMDSRGTGLSDRFSPADVPPPEVLMEDIAVVMDAAGVERAVVFGGSNSGSLCALFAATYPERVSALIVYGAEPRSRISPDFPWAWTDQEWDDYLSALVAGWGSSEYSEQLVAWLTPSLAGDPAQRRWWERLQRLSASPNSIAGIEQIWRDIDIRPILPTIQAPTLILHRTGDPIEDVEAGRDFARGVPGARFVELPVTIGRHGPAIRVQSWTRWRRLSRARSRRLHDSIGCSPRVMFTDIVGSTERAAMLGDQRWRELLEAHNLKVRALVSRYRGVERGTAGDGFLATFDGPARAVTCALAVAEAMHAIDLEVRSGVHTGECQISDNDLSGIAVHIGARVSALAGPGQVLVSSTVRDLVAGSGIEFTEHGRHALKGVDGEWTLFEAVGETCLTLFTSSCADARVWHRVDFNCRLP